MVTISDAVRRLDRDLHELFRERLKSVVTYVSSDGPEVPTPSLAVVQQLTADDLRACASRIESWHGSGLATPLLLEEQEFARSLDVFPFEFGAILAEHAIVSGVDPFTGLRVDPTDLRRACEVQARSHLLHLREGYLETRGRSDALAELISRSASPLLALVSNVTRLDNRPGDPIAAAAHLESKLGSGGALEEVIRLAPDKPISSERARALFPAYLDAVVRLAHHIDRWGAA